jgi:hypothetical protein
MKTITKDNSSCYLFEDSIRVVIENERTVVGDPEELIISDINLSNGQVYENVTPPTDWVGNKYLFDGVNWTTNPNYDEPKPTTSLNNNGITTL